MQFVCCHWRSRSQDQNMFRQARYTTGTASVFAIFPTRNTLAKCSPRNLIKEILPTKRRTAPSPYYGCFLADNTCRFEPENLCTQLRPHRSFWSTFHHASTDFGRSESFAVPYCDEEDMMNAKQKLSHDLPVTSASNLQSPTWSEFLLAAASFDGVTHVQRFSGGLL